MCGHDLQEKKTQNRRVSWLDAVLVLVVLVVVAFWWRNATQPQAAAPEPVITIPSEVVLPTATLTPTPEPTPTATPMPAPTPYAHQVESGETLLSIAGKYDITVADLQAANGLVDALIRVGDELLIPQGATLPAAVVQQATSSVFNYVVKPGDTIVSIAIRFGTTVEAILAANDLTPDDFIQPDQNLLVPVGELPPQVLESSEQAVIELGADGNDVQEQPAIYAAPRLLGPVDEFSLDTNETLLFRWLSVDLLQPNEWYVLRVWSADGAYPDPASVWTKATSYRLTTDLDLDTDQTVGFRWQVSVVRVLPDQGVGRELQAASFPSEIRLFSWR
jgi:LysM repeat protein